VTRRVGVAVVVDREQLLAALERKGAVARRAPSQCRRRHPVVEVGDPQPWLSLSALLTYGVKGG
jgi:hypothetical protein